MLRPLLLIPLLAACTPREQHGVTQIIEVPAAVRTVRLDHRKGSVALVPGEPGRISVRARVMLSARSQGRLERLRSVSRQIEVEHRGAELTLRSPRVSDERERAQDVLVYHVRLEVPPLDQLVVRSGRGPVRVRGVESAVDVEIRDAGELVAQDVGGNTRLATLLGNATIDGHRHALEVEIGQSGNIVAFVEHLGGAVELRTEEGFIQCHVPEESAFVLDGRTDLGEVTNGFEVPVQKIGRLGERMHGGHGEGDTPIVLRSGRGRLSLGRLDR